MKSKLVEGFAVTECYLSCRYYWESPHEVHEFTRAQHVRRIYDPVAVLLAHV